MKHYFLTFGFLFVFSVFLNGQDNKLIYSKQESKRVEKSSEILQRSEAFVSIDFVGIDLDKIPEYEQFVLQFGKNNILINKEQVNVRGINNFCFVGSNNANNSILISVLDGDIQGVIETENGVYAIETIGENNYVIIKVDQSKLNDCGGVLSEIDDELDGKIDRYKQDTSNTNYHNYLNENSEHNYHQISPILQSAITRQCKIRVLVLYTPYALPNDSSAQD